MRCPFCNYEDTQVKDSRPSEDGMSIRRRRVCTACNSRFTTFERIQLRELQVIKKSGDIRPFDRDKISRSITVATRKRDISSDKIEMIVNKIVRDIEALGESEITTQKIGEMIMDELAVIDKIAYVRFASVYKDFCEVKDFEKFIKDM